MSSFSRKPNIDEVARRAGVTRSTVSKAFSGNANYPVNEKTRAHIFKIAEKIGYQPSVAARRMNARRSRVIALLEQESWSLLNSINNPSTLAADRFSGAHDVTHAVGYDLLPVTMSSNTYDHQRLLRMYLGQHFDGILCISPHFEMGFILPLVKQGCVVITDAFPASHRNLLHHPSWLDVETFLKTMVPHVAAAGRKNLTAPFPDSFRGPKEVRLVNGSSFGIFNGDEGLDERVAEFLAQHPKTDAFLVPDDLQAWRIYRSLSRLGRRVPEEITLAGLSDFRNPLRPLPEHLLVQSPIAFTAREMTRRLIATLEPELIPQLDRLSFPAPRTPAILSNTPQQFRVLANFAERLERLSEDSPASA